MRTPATMATILGAAALALMTMPALAQVSSDESTRYPERDASRVGVGAHSIRATFTVYPGQRIQDAVDRAQPGDRIEVMPGIYHEAVTVDFDNIELIGVIENGERPVLDGHGKLNDAVMAAGNDFTIANFELRNYQSNGVVVNQAKNCTFLNIVADNTGKYGVYPVLSDGVLIEDCVVSNVWDAGIYAGQSKNVEIRNCEAFRNTIGIEAENCVNVLIHNNTAHDNSLGILIVLLPDLPTKTATDARVINNRVYNNNYPNLAPEGNLVSGVVPGIGIAVSAADHTEVTKNHLQGNNSFGVTVTALTDSFPDKELDVEPNPDGNIVHHNTFADNGAKLSGRYIELVGSDKGADLFWSGKGVGNGWDEPGATSIPPILPGWTGGIAGGGGE